MSEQPNQPATAAQQVKFQQAIAFQASVQAEGFFENGYPFPHNPPGREFWQAVLASRKAKTGLEKTRAVVRKALG